MQNTTVNNSVVNQVQNMNEVQETLIKYASDNTPEYNIKVDIKEARLKVQYQNEIKYQIEDVVKSEQSVNDTESKNSLHYGKPTRIIVLKPPKKEDNSRKKNPTKSTTKKMKTENESTTPNITRYFKKENTGPSITSAKIIGQHNRANDNINHIQRCSRWWSMSAGHQTVQLYTRMM